MKYIEVFFSFENRYKIMIKLKKLEELKKLKNFNLIDFVIPIIDLMCPMGYSRKGYNNRYFFTCLLDFVQICVSWRKYWETIEFPIKGKYLNEIHNKYCKAGVYDEIKRQLTNKYLETDRENKLKYQKIDSSFIANKEGSLKDNNYLLTEEEKIKNNKIRANNINLPVGLTLE